MTHENRRYYSPKREKKLLRKNNWFNYWFPLPKGYNRLLIVFACLIIVYTVHEYPEKVNTFSSLC